jgi:hypothetical protein
VNRHVLGLQTNLGKLCYMVDPKFTREKVAYARAEQSRVLLEFEVTCAALKAARLAAEASG